MPEKIIPLILEKVEYLIGLIKEKPCETCQQKHCLLPWLDKKQVSEHLRISRSTYYTWIDAGIITPDSKEGEDRFLIETINKFVAGEEGRRERRKSS